LLVAIGLAGCGNSPQWDNHGYGWHYNATTSSGWKVRWDDVVTEATPAYLSDVNFYEITWQRMRECTGMDGPPAFVVVKPLAYIQARYGAHVGGYYHHNPPLLVVDETAGSLPHEQGHHLLLHTTGDSDNDHHHPMFGTDGCTSTVKALGYKLCGSQR